MSFPQSPVEDAFLAYRATRDPAALAAVYDGCVARMLAVAMHIAGGSAAAEDAVQETFLFAMQHPERWDETRPLVPWLLGILGNRLKQAACRARWTPDPGRLQQPEGDSPDTAAEASEVLAEIESAITDLPQPYRTVVLLRLRNGLSPADIAVALDRKPSTVRAQLTRGFEMLRKALPTVVGALLVGSLATAQGQEGIRKVVMERAEVARQMLSPRAVLSPAASIALATVVLVVLAVVVWSLLQLGSPIPQSESTNHAAIELEPNAAVVARDEALSLAPPIVDADRRELVATDGSLRVSVRCGGVALPHAAIELEPLGHPPQALVHYTTTGRGSWREIASVRSTPPELFRHGESDAGGDCAFSGLLPGVWICRALGHNEVVVVSPATEATVTMTVEAGCGVVEGLVLGPDGLAVADAPVWTCREHLQRCIEVVTRSDANGRFVLAVAPFTTIGTEHAGFAPVAYTVTATSAAPRRSVVLQLRDAGSALEGVVVDGDGKPAVGVTVQVGHAADAVVVATALEPQVLARPHRLLTDAEGRFAFEALVPGEVVVECCGPGSLGRHVVQLDAGQRLSTVCQVVGTAIVEGHVRDRSGQPLVGVSVSVGRRGQLGHRRTVTDGEGAFRLEGVPSGQPVIEVADYRGGFAARVIACRPGERAQCDVELAAGNLDVRGVVVDAAGGAVSNVWMACVSSYSLEVIPVAADGSFTTTVSERIAALPVELRFYDRYPRDAEGRLVVVPRLVRRGVRVGAEPLRIELPRPVMAAVRLRGQVRDADGAPLAGVFLLRGEAEHRRWNVPVTTAADGTFAVGPLEPGSYRLTHATATWGTATFAIAAGEERDVGVVRLPRPSADQPLDYLLQLALMLPDAAAGSDEVRLRVQDEHGNEVLSKPPEAGFSSEWVCFFRLPAGRYQLFAETASGLFAQREIVVDPAALPRRALPVVFAPR